MVGLTLYDINREPRAVQGAAEAGGVVERPIRALNMELTCPICLGILKNTVPPSAAPR